MPHACIELSAFAHDALDREASRQGVSIEDLIAHAAMYYLADLDSGRLALRAIDVEPATPRQQPGPRRGAAAF